MTLVFSILATAAVSIATTSLMLKWQQRQARQARIERRLTGGMP